MGGGPTPTGTARTRGRPRSDSTATGRSCPRARVRRRATGRPDRERPRASLPPALSHPPCFDSRSRGDATRARSTPRRPFYQDARHHRTRSWRSGRIAIAGTVLVAAAVAVAALAGCDAASPGPTAGTPPPLPTASADQQALVAQAFEDVEVLFALGFEDAARPLAAARGRSRHDTSFGFELGARDSASTSDRRTDTNFHFERGLPDVDASDATKKRQDTDFRFEQGPSTDEPPGTKKSRTDTAFRSAEGQPDTSPSDVTKKRQDTSFHFERVGAVATPSFSVHQLGIRVPLVRVSDPPLARKRQDTNFRFERGALGRAESRVDARAVPRVVSVDEALGTAARMAVDTTTYTGVYDAANTRGYLVQMQYRQPQGVGVWTARVQHGRTVTGPTGGTFDAVETVTLTFLDYPALEAFISALASGSVPYLTGASQNAEASFAAFDTWRVAQVYSPAEGTAVVSYANAELRESITIREPVVTLNTNGTGTVRDGDRTARCARATTAPTSRSRPRGSSRARSCARSPRPATPRTARS